MIMSALIHYCFIAVCASLVFTLTVILISFILYMMVGAITSLIDTFKEVRTKKKANKFLKSINTLSKALDSKVIDVKNR